MTKEQENHYEAFHQSVREEEIEKLTKKCVSMRNPC